MQTAEMFQSLLNNLKIPDERTQAIATHYKNATSRLNIKFRGSANGFNNRLLSHEFQQVSLYLESGQNQNTFLL
jgi:hypothetical protein